MTLLAANYIRPHPRPFMEYHFPRFQTYPSIEQLPPRPTWQGFQPQLSQMVPGRMAGLGSTAPSPGLTAVGILGTVAILGVGLGAGYLLWGRP